MRSSLVTAAPSNTLGASPCWEWMSMPEAFRMWLDSLAPLSGSCRVNREKPMGMPAKAISNPHRQSWPTVATMSKTRMPTVWDRGSERLCQLKTRPRPSVG